MSPLQEITPSQFNYFKQNLYHIAELVLQQTLALCDIIENNSHDDIPDIIRQDKRLYKFKKENEAISANVILEVIEIQHRSKADLSKMKYLYSEEPLNFTLASIRIMVYLEQIGENISDIAQAYANYSLDTVQILGKYELLHQMLTRMTTMVGIVVESLVEEKDRFFGSVREVREELNHNCLEISQLFWKDEQFQRNQFLPLLLLIVRVKQIGRLSIDIAEELLQLSRISKS